MYKLNFSKNYIKFKGYFENNEELWGKKIKKIEVYGNKNKTTNSLLDVFSVSLGRNKIDYEILKKYFKKIKKVKVTLNSFNGIGNDELSSVVKEIFENTKAIFIKVSLDNENNDVISFKDGNVYIEIDGSSLEIKNGKINVSAFPEEFKDMVLYLSIVNDFLLPANQKALNLL